MSEEDLGMGVIAAKGAPSSGQHKQGEVCADGYSYRQTGSTFDHAGKELTAASKTPGRTYSAVVANTVSKIKRRFNMRPK